jgi:hypothetical protein
LLIGNTEAQATKFIVIFSKDFVEVIKRILRDKRS